MALRDPARRGDHARLIDLATRIRSGAFGPVRHLIHIGIGGSALGPQLLVDALGAGADGPEVHVAANIDGAALARAFAACNPAETLLIAVSKTFTTQETLTNLDSALRWLADAGVADPVRRVVAVTAAPARAEARGIAEILPFADSVGGRYSLWSAVGLPLAVRCGAQAFEALLDGAHAMDRHFLARPLALNAPVLAAMADVWQACFLNRPTRAIFAYDERLRLLPPYLQQLEMESNGKSVARDGTPLPFPTAAISWGGTGTDAQHAVFQLLHQGTHGDPIEFVAVAKPGHSLDPVHHRLLLANCFAQGAALLKGRTEAEALQEAGGDAALARAKAFPGNRGSATILLDELTPARLGALLAFYEARTFSAAVMMGLNPFDQWGVELGKQVANRLAEGQTEGFDPSTEALMRTAGF
jgi:glucose-6-phosphate isomerase